MAVRQILGDLLASAAFWLWFAFCVLMTLSIVFIVPLLIVLVAGFVSLFF